ncbi:hypothetical protein AC141_18430 [Bacteroides fragilis]|nr:hypothetical protein AC141_18430 [Bacteroides fragilis]
MFYFHIYDKCLDKYSESYFISSRVLEKYSYFCPSTNKLTKWNNRITNHSFLRKGFRHLQVLLSFW